MTATSRPVSQRTSQSTRVTAEAPDQQRVGGIDRQRHDPDQRQADEEQDGEQAALRLDPGEPQQLFHPRKAR